jgi:D-xylose transport system permease protein
MEHDTGRFSLKTYSGNLRAYAMILALVLIWGLFSFATEGGFMTARNLSNLARQSCITGILAIGMVLVIVSANIDLSVGSMVGLTGGIAAILNVWWEMGIIPALGITLVTGLAIGLLQGWLVSYLRIPAFIVTLAGLLVFRGIIKGGTGGETVGPVSDSFKTLGQGYLGTEVSWIIATIVIAGIFSGVWRRYVKRKQQKIRGGWTELVKGILFSVAIVLFVSTMTGYEGIPVPVMILLTLALVFHFLTTNTTFGRRVYAIGGNVEAAHLSGINIRRNTTVVFILMGILGAVAGIVYTARVGSATADAGKILELDAIAACVIGGTSLMGGRGTIGGALVGALIMASLDNGMSLMNVEDFYQDIIKGLILVIAVWIDIASKKK